MVLFAVLLACKDSPPDSNSSGSLDAQYELGETLPNVIHVSWDSVGAGNTYVEWGIDDVVEGQTQATPAADGELVEVLVVGPPSGTQVFVRAVQELDSGERIEGGVEYFEIPEQPEEIPEITLDGTRSASGYLLTSLVGPGNTYLTILDHLGRVVWYWRMPSNQLVIGFELLESGEGILVMGDVLVEGGSENTLFELGWDGGMRRSMVLPNGHHNFTQLPDGRIAWIQVETGEMGVDGETVKISGDAVRISDWADTADVSEPPLLSMLRDIGATEPLCEHQLTTISVEGQQVYDWSHANSLRYDAERDELSVLTHHIDQVLVFSAQTGEIIKRITPDEGDLSQDEGEQWSHAHSSQFSREGLLLFDNGLHFDPPRSRVVEYEIDPDTDELTQTFEVWEFNDKEVHALGDVITLPWGNRLVSWSTLGYISELDSAGTTRWIMSTPTGSETGRVVWIDRLP